MYLHEIYMRNSGPIKSLDLQLEFADNGSPHTYVFLGTNGSGKTNVLSLVADALFEGAASYFDDVLVSEGISRRWFRVVGTNTISYGEPGGFSILKFVESAQTHYYQEKAGSFPLADAKQLLPSDAAAAAQWDDSGNTKQFKLPEDAARRAYEHGAYVYFPSSRAEYPHWLNMGALREDRFSTAQPFATQLGKPIFVEQGVQQFAQWLTYMCVL